MTNTVSKMTAEEQRIAIAEACGAIWKEDNFKNRMLVDEGKDRVLFIDVHGGFDIGLPDYLNDLNAMHEAEKVLTGDMKSDYFMQLNELTKPHEYGFEGFAVVQSTAAQRAEAFLKTLGLWKDE